MALSVSKERRVANANNLLTGGGDTPPHISMATPLSSLSATSDDTHA